MYNFCVKSIQNCIFLILNLVRRTTLLLQIYMEKTTKLSFFKFRTWAKDNLKKIQLCYKSSITFHIKQRSYITLIINYIKKVRLG